MAEPWTRADLDSLKTAYDRLFKAGLTLPKIKDAALGGRLFPRKVEGTGVPGRSIAWKLFLLSPVEPLQAAKGLHVDPYLDSLRKTRVEYKDLLMEKMRAPDGSYEEGLSIPGLSSSPPRTTRIAGNLDLNNPLSLHDENPWKEWFASIELRRTIMQDVERTFPDIPYFRDMDIQGHLANILYLWSVTNPAIGYRQGMHELLAMLYYAVDFDSVVTIDVAPGGSVLSDLCSRTWVAADAWALFVTVMNSVGRWYEWRESPSVSSSTSSLANHVNLPLGQNGQVEMKPYVAPIVQACNTVQSIYLRSVDPKLWQSMQAAGIEPQIYGIRWLRLLFTREFNTNDSMMLWDGLFACDPTFDLAQWICVAMLLRIRNQLIPTDYSGQLTCLLRYPPPPTPVEPADPNDPPSPHHATLLLRQALGLQLSPTPMAGASIIYENRNFLNIAVEVPEPPPPPMRRQARHADRSKSEAVSEPGTSRIPHNRQQSQALNLPEIARGLLDRGESLGINKTSFFNAVSELRRNLPEIAASAASFVRTPTTPGNFPAFPMVDERPPEERPPWEPRPRSEMEREIASLKSVQKRVGESVGWIVDTLLLDESGVKTPEEAKHIQDRKREALECLAYVRDILRSGAAEVEEDRLWGDEELRRRKQGISAPRSRAPSPRISTPPPAVVAPDHAPAVESRSRSSTAGRSVSPSATRSAPRTADLPPTAFATRPLSPTATPTSPPAFSPHADATQLAPWSYTQSNFSAPTPSVPTPPRTSAATRTRHSHTRSSTPPIPASASQSKKEPPSGGQPQRRQVDLDPLGALT